MSDRSAIDDLIEASELPGGGRTADRSAALYARDLPLTVDALHATAQFLKPHVATDAIIKFATDYDGVDYARLLSAAGVVSVEDLGAGMQLWHLSTSFERAYAQIGSSGDFSFFQPNYDITPADLGLQFGTPGIIPVATAVPNDPSFGLTYGMNKINAPAAWNITTGNTVKVAVIDTGVDWTHPDLAANIWSNPNEIAGNGIDDDHNGYIDDVHGWDFVNNDNNPMDDNDHGTHVAGTIGAVGGNGIGVAGVNWSVEIIPLKFLDSDGSGSDADAIKAINYAASIGAKVINASWGSYYFDSALQSAIAAASNTLFVAAAGNDANDNDGIYQNFPSSYTLNNVVAVAATDSSDHLAWFSNYGATSVDLAAPGVGIYSTIPGNSYAYFSGTSMATPHVAGAAALLWAANPSLTVAQVKNALLSTVDPLPSLSGEVRSGGRLDVFNALQSVTEHAPVVTASNVTLARSADPAAASLFSVSDVDGDAIVTYRLYDQTADASSGYWVVNGVAQAANQNIDLSPSQIAQTTFHAGTSGTDVLYVQVFDGTLWSNWVSFQATTVNHLPVISVANRAAAHGQSIAASSLFTVSDVDGDAITQYQFWDDHYADGTADDNPAADLSGFFALAGVRQTEGAAINVTAAQLSSLTFEPQQGDNVLWVRAFDGIGWGAWKEFNVTAPVNRTPVAVAPDIVVNHGQSLTAASLFTASDGDGDSITKYQFWDDHYSDGTMDDNPASDTSGYFSLSGVRQPEGAAIEVSTAQLSALIFDSQEGDNALWVRAFDGIGWGAWKEFHVAAPIDRAPVAVAPDVVVNHGQSITAASLFTVSDGDGDAITKYQFWDDHYSDGTTDDNPASDTSGYFSLSGVRQSEGAAIEVSAAQLSSLTFEPQEGDNVLWARAFDGLKWGSWTEFSVTAPADHKPIADASDIVVSHGQSIAASSLFSVSDTDGDAITQYQLWDDHYADGTADDNPAYDPSGYFAFAGVRQAEGVAINITAAQLSSLTFEPQERDNVLWVRAFDGVGWGAWKEFHVAAPPDQNPVVTAADVSLPLSSTVAASSLFAANDADGDAMTRYQFWDSTAGGTTAHFELGGAVQGTGVAIDVLASQLDEASLVAGSSPDTDLLWARAFDGIRWSDWHSFNAVSHA